MAEKDKNPSPKLAAQIFADVGKHLETHMVKADNLESEKIIERNLFAFFQFSQNNIKIIKKNIFEIQLSNKMKEKDSKSVHNSSNVLNVV